jgi:hypothetical protein
MAAGHLQHYVGSHDGTALMTPQIVFDNDKRPLVDDHHSLSWPQAICNIMWEATMGQPS